MTDHHIRTPPAAAEVVERERNTHDGYEAVDMDPEPTFREDERKEQDAETSEVSEDGESEREDEYNFQFEGEMDPLLFVEGEGTSSFPLYEVFQRIEDQYKALAAMKRPAPDNNESEMPAKRLRQDEETTGATREEIEEAMNFGVRKRKSRKERRRGRKKGSNNTVSPEVTRKLGDATLHYAQGHFDKRAIIFYMIAAHLTPKDASLWKLILAKSIEHEDIKQAYYCL